MDKKCKDCWHFAKQYFCDKDCCLIDEDIITDDGDTGIIHFVNADDECCNRFEQDLNRT